MFATFIDFRHFQTPEFDKLDLTKLPAYPTKRSKAPKTGRTTESLKLDQNEISYSQASLQCARHKALELQSDLAENECLETSVSACSALTLSPRGYKELWVAVDSGAEKGLIGEREVGELGLPTESADNKYILITANGEVPSNTQAVLETPGVNHVLKPGVSSTA